MPQLDIETALHWRGRTVVDRDGEKIGKFEELYLDEADRPAWAAVNTGLFGLRQTFVPLTEAQPVGDQLQVPFDKERVKAAPNVDPDAQLSNDEEQLLYRHYGLAEGPGATEPPAEPAGREDRPGDAAPQAAAEPAGARAAAAEEAPASADDRERVEPEGAPAKREGDTPVEMIRSEEEVDVGTRRRVRGRARLKKYVVTDEVQKPVPVQREEVRVEYEPPEGEDAPRDRQSGG